MKTQFKSAWRHYREYGWVSTRFRYGTEMADTCANVAHSLNGDPFPYVLLRRRFEAWRARKSNAMS